MESCLDTGFVSLLLVKGDSVRDSASESEAMCTIQNLHVLIVQMPGLLFLLSGTILPLQQLLVKPLRRAW